MNPPAHLVLLYSSLHNDLAWLHTAPVSYITQLEKKREVGVKQLHSSTLWCLPFVASITKTLASNVDPDQSVKDQGLHCLLYRNIIFRIRNKMNQTALNWQLSHLMTKTKWHVHPVKTQISLCIRPVWSESSLGAHAILLVLLWGSSYHLCLVAYFWFLI